MRETTARSPVAHMLSLLWARGPQRIPSCRPAARAHVNLAEIRLRSFSGRIKTFRSGSMSSIRRCIGLPFLSNGAVPGFAISNLPYLKAEVGGGMQVRSKENDYGYSSGESPPKSNRYAQIGDCENLEHRCRRLGDHTRIPPGVQIVVYIYRDSHIQVIACISSLWSV